MLIARCPHCQTTLRATPEALRARAGKVRCGQCQKAFNALDHLVDEAPATSERPRSDGFELMPSEGASPVPEHDNEGGTAENAHLGADVVSGEESVAPEIDKPESALAPEAASEESTSPESDLPSAASTAAESQGLIPATSIDPLFEAQQAGLVAAREASEVPGYSKWTAGTFAQGGVAFHEPKKTSWLMILLSLLLGTGLLIQLAYIFRTEIAARWPDSRPWLEEGCRSAGCTVAYPASPELIDIQASELQIDPTRGGMLVLYLTLQNKSDYAQAYPSVELTLTDVREQVVVRRLLAPQDWLPPKLEHPAAFAAQGEVAARLWIDPQDTGAVGYGLKVVYP